MIGRIEIAYVTQDVAKCVADLSIVLRNDLHDLFGADDIFSEVHRRSPQTNDFAAHAFSDVHGIGGVAQRLRLRAALFVQRPSAGQHTFIWGTAFSADGAQQGRVEPSTMLVAAFQIEVRGPGEV